MSSAPATSTPSRRGTALRPPAAGDGGRPCHTAAVIRRAAWAASLWSRAAYLSVLAAGYLAGVGHIPRHRVESASYVFAAVAALVAAARHGRTPMDRPPGSRTTG